MKTGSHVAVVAVLALRGSGTSPHAAAAGAIACEALRQVPLTNGTLISAESVQAGAFRPPGATNAPAADAFRNLPAFCRVTARLTNPPTFLRNAPHAVANAVWPRRSDVIGINPPAPDFTRTSAAGMLDHARKMRAPLCSGRRTPGFPSFYRCSLFLVRKTSLVD